MKKHALILTVLCAVLFFSCEKIIDFNGDGTAPMIVVNGLLIPGKPVEVSVTKSQSFLADSYSFEILTDAKVDLYVDNEFAETLKLEEVEDTEVPAYYPYSSKWVFCGETIAENGKTYRLEVANDGLSPVSCETTVPAPVKLLEVDTATVFVPNNWGRQELLGINIKFEDEAELNNFYRVQVDQISGVNKGNYSGKEENSDTIILVTQQMVSLDLFDPIFGNKTDEADEIVTGTPDNEYALFDDTQINGKEYTLEVRLSYNYNVYYSYSLDEDRGDFLERKIVLYALSPEYYEYLKSATNHFYYADDYFSEPVPVYSNVSGGMGIFGALDSASYSVISGTYPMEGKVYVNNGYNGGYYYVY